MLTRCRKGLVIVSGKTFLRGGGRLEQDWVTRLGDAAWVDWRLVAETKCRLPHSQDTVTRGRTEVYSGTTSIVSPGFSRPPLLSALSPPELPWRRALAVPEEPSEQTWAKVVRCGAPPTSSQASVPIQPPLQVPGTAKERQRSSPHYTTTAETPRRSFPVLEQPSERTSTKVVNHVAMPTSPPRASVPIQSPLKASGTKYTYNHTTTSGTSRHMYNHTPGQTPGQTPDDSEDTSKGDGIAGCWWEWPLILASKY